MLQVLLVGKDWKTRALLRAQLIEEGLEVEAHESVNEALESLQASPVLPALLVADLAASDDPATECDQLTAWAARLPIWIIASHTLIMGESLQGRGFELILFRPVDMQELVNQIKRRLESP